MGKSAAEIQAEKNLAEAKSTLAKAAEDNTKFQREQFKKWESIYGSLEANLGKYYNSLNPSQLANKRIKQAQRAHAETVTKIRGEMRRRGLTGSGLEQSLLSQAYYAQELVKTQAFDQAQQEIIGHQQNFLRMGMSKGLSQQQMVGQAMGQQTQVAGQLTSMAAQRAYEERQRRRQFEDFGMNTLGSGIEAAASIGTAYATKGLSKGSGRYSMT